MFTIFSKNDLPKSEILFPGVLAKFRKMCYTDENTILGAETPRGGAVSDSERIKTMHRKFFMRFPEGRAKALTFSYDDGVEQDIRLIDLFDRYGMKGTFNINSGCFSPEGTVWEPGTIHRRMSERQVLELYGKGQHEVAVHSLTHPYLETLPTAVMAHEVLTDRVNLERLFGKIIRGMAYPMGTFSDELVSVLKSCGVVYSRTTKTTGGFDVPTDWLRLAATAKHTDPGLMELAEKFVTMKAGAHPKLFYLWGHSYEFERDNNWNVIEDFTAYMAGREAEIWYATNIEIYDYVQAFRGRRTSGGKSHPSHLVDRGQRQDGFGRTR